MRRPIRELRRLAQAIGILVVGGVMLSAVACGAAAPSSTDRLGTTNQSSESKQSAGVAEVGPRTPTEAPAAAPNPSQPNVAGEATASDQAANADTQRMVIRNATMTLVVADVDQASAEITKLTNSFGGWVVTATNEDRGETRSGKIVIRVPADRLDEAIGQVKGFAKEVRRENISSQDVTEEFIDNDARVRALKAQEDAYLQLLQRSNTVEEIIRVRQALTNVRQEIERSQARMNYLQRSAAMASISIDLLTPSAAPVAGRGWSAVETFFDAGQGLLDTLTGVVTVLIYAITYVPIWGPVVLFVWWLRRRRRRSRGLDGGTIAAEPSTPPTAPSA